MLFRTQIIFCSSELRLHFRIAEVGSLLSLNRAWRAQVTYYCRLHDDNICDNFCFQIARSACDQRAFVLRVDLFVLAFGGFCDIFAQDQLSLDFCFT